MQTPKERFRRCRKMLGYSQKQFSTRFAVPLPTIQGWECEKTNKAPKEYYIFLLEQYLLLKGVL